MGLVFRFSKRKLDTLLDCSARQSPTKPTPSKVLSKAPNGLRMHRSVCGLSALIRRLMVFFFTWRFRAPLSFQFGMRVPFFTGLFNPNPFPHAKTIRSFPKVGFGPLVRLALGLALLVATLSSCTSARKLAYFQNDTTGTDTLNIPEAYVPTIRPGDVLSVQVSSLNSEAAAFFNPTATASAPTAMASVGNALPMTPGYLVAPDGSIRLPLVGQVALANLTTAQASDAITARLKTYLKEPTVNVRNQSFRISVLGEVARPSLFTIPNERITLPEALGLAGDLTIYGRRDNVLVIREEGTKRVFTRLDLTRRDAFRSPYYTLHPNDVVYVEPGKARATSADRFYQFAPIVTGMLSLIAIIVTRR